MGQIVFQPISATPEDLEKASLVIIPERINKDFFNVAVEWAAATQVPIFCHGADVPFFEAEGFGSYRFHRLDTYREVEFQGGSLEFFPALRRKAKGIRGISQELAERTGFLKTPSFHVLMRPRNERPVLYLASTQISASEWSVLTRSKPDLVIGSPAATKTEWQLFSTLIKKRVVPAQGLETVKTQPLTREKAAREGPAWDSKPGSLPS